MMKQAMKEIGVDNESSCPAFLIKDKANEIKKKVESLIRELSIV